MRSATVTTIREVRAFWTTRASMVQLMAMSSAFGSSSGVTSHGPTGSNPAKG